jgi:heptosyltransferase III
LQRKNQVLTKRLHTYWQFRMLYWNAFSSFTSVILRSLICSVTHKKLVVIALYEHIGDIIACEPIISHIKEQHPTASVTWMINKRYAELLEKHPGLAHVHPLQSLSEWILLKKLLAKYNFNILVADLHIDERRCSVYGFKLKQTNMEHYNQFTNKSLLQSFASNAGLGEMNEAPVFYLNPSKAVTSIQKPYIVIHTQTNGVEKDWLPEKWSELCEKLMAHGYSVVEVGLNKQVSLSNKLYIDYTGERSLQSIANVINECNFFIGLDSAFAHMANALQKPGLVLMGNYSKGKLLFNRFNPFTGNYADASHIIYNENGPVAELDVESVYTKVLSLLDTQAVSSNSSHSITGKAIPA